LRLFELGARIIEQDHPVKAAVAGCVSSSPSPQFKQEASLLREESLQCNGLRAIFIGASAFIPKGGLVIGAFIIADRRRTSHFVAWSFAEIVKRKSDSRVIVPDYPTIRLSD
jgi:hypothetical protein